MNKYNSEIEQLHDTVIKGNYCIGCGACALIKDSPFEIKMNEYGNYIAYLAPQKRDIDNQIKLLDICPFSGESKNEDKIGEIFFKKNKKDSYIGNYLKCFAGYVSEGNYRTKGSSGGFGKWLGYILLKENTIDYFVQVAANITSRSDVPLFDYKVFTTADEVIQGSKSSYYPVTLEKVVKIIQETEGRYAITGVPCFIKTLRLLSIRNPILAERIQFTIGIVCGGMKSANHAKMIGWQLGVHPDNLIAIDFRRKYKDRPASYKIYQVWSNKDNIERYKTDSEIIGTGFGEGYFKPNACDYCDDVVGETADISLGDAWLPQYVKDPRGTSVMVVRNPILLEILEKYNAKEVVHLEEISKEEVLKSQDGGFRHRREALSYRLSKKVGNDEWFPKKRVVANQFSITAKRKKIYSMRETIAQKSHIVFLEALQKNDFDLFIKRMKPIQKHYINLIRGSIFRRGLRKIKRMIIKLFSRNKIY